MQPMVTMDSNSDMRLKPNAGVRRAGRPEPTARRKPAT
jgi:hypothetical protein